MDFAVSRPLVRHSRLISGFCPSTRTFDPCFFQTPPRGGSPCIITRPSPPSGWPEDFHPQAAEHAQHTTKSLARWTATGPAFRNQVPPSSCVGVSAGVPDWTVSPAAGQAASRSRKLICRPIRPKKPEASPAQTPEDTACCPRMAHDSRPNRLNRR